jgi:hypothetical protein
MSNGFHVPTDKELNAILKKHGCTMDTKQTASGSRHKKWRTSEGKPFIVATDGRQMTQAAAFHTLDQAGIDREVLRSKQGQVSFAKQRTTVTPEPVEAVVQVTPEASKSSRQKEYYGGRGGQYISNDLSAEERERLARAHQDRLRLQPLDLDKVQHYNSTGTTVRIVPIITDHDSIPPEKTTHRIVHQPWTIEMPATVTVPKKLPPRPVVQRPHMAGRH